MNAKKIIIVGSMVIAITISAGLYGNDASANTLISSIDKSGSFGNTGAAAAKRVDLTEALGVASDEALYDALYNGSSLAEIAVSHDVNPQDVIDLQVAELTEQLNARLLNGSITWSTYQQQKAELPEIIANSVHVKMTL